MEIDANSGLCLKNDIKCNDVIRVVSSYFLSPESLGV